jgi:hypothetical protein
MPVEPPNGKAWGMNHLGTSTSMAQLHVGIDYSQVQTVQYFSRALVALQPCRRAFCLCDRSQVQVYLDLSLRLLILRPISFILRVPVLALSECHVPCP